MLRMIIRVPYKIGTNDKMLSKFREEFANVANCYITEGDVICIEFPNTVFGTVPGETDKTLDLRLLDIY